MKGESLASETAFLHQLTALGIPWIPDDGGVWVHQSAIKKLFDVGDRTARDKLKAVPRAPSNRQFFLFREFLIKNGH